MHETDFDPFAAGFICDPYRALDVMRAHGSVQVAHQPNGIAAHLVLSHRLARHLLTDKRVVADPEFGRAILEPAGFLPPRGTSAPSAASMLTTDPPVHTGLRRALAAALPDGGFASYRPLVEQTVARRLAELAGTSGFDLVADVAHPITVHTLASMLGVPVVDMAPFTGWITAAMTPIHRDGAPEARRRGQASLRTYLAELIATVAREPRPDAFVGRLVAGYEFGSAPRSTDPHDDVLDLMVELVFAGYLTTAGLIVNAFRAVLLDGDARRRLAEGPIAGGEVDELMRFDGPAFRGSLRFAADDVDTPAGTIPRGGLISVMFAATNRDADVYRDPGRLCFTRSGEPEHLGFSHGVHKCWGAPVARAEVAETLTQVLRAFPRIALAEDPASIEWTQVGNSRSCARLMVDA